MQCMEKEIQSYKQTVMFRGTPFTLLFLFNLGYGNIKCFCSLCTEVDLCSPLHVRIRRYGYQILEQEKSSQRETHIKEIKLQRQPFTYPRKWRLDPPPSFKDVRHFPKGIFQSGNFPNMQFNKRYISKYVLAAALGNQHVHCSKWRLRRSNLTFWKWPLGKLQI